MMARRRLHALVRMAATAAALSAMVTMATATAACTALRPGQGRGSRSGSPLADGRYVCGALVIDPTTGGSPNCTADRVAPVFCQVLPGVDCVGPGNFTQSVPCRYVGTTDYFTAVGLSLFLGALGADRFYLGYVGYGFVKLVTLGLFFIGYLVDLILILVQIVGPVDGSDYSVPVTGPAFTQVVISNATYFQPLN